MSGSVLGWQQKPTLVNGSRKEIYEKALGDLGISRRARLKVLPGIRMQSSSCRDAVALAARSSPRCWHCGLQLDALLQLLL